MRLAPLLVVLLLAGVALGVAAEAPWGIKGTPTTAAPRTFVRHYPVLGADAKTVVGTQAWLVVNGTGNCCENHLTVTSTGRIIDIGASWPTYTDDGGRTWRQASAFSGPLAGAEGSGASAPNGDWVGMTWDPYTGDRVVAYKYVAAEDAWYVSHVALHGPFYDRPWLSVVPGPITFQGQTYPYAALMQGGVGASTSYLSLDGLTYVLVSPADLGGLATERSWLDQPAGVAWADWVQPIAASRTVPLPGGGALVDPNLWCPWVHLEADLDARCWTYGNGREPASSSVLRFDSKGRLHSFERVPGGMAHRMSGDGGRTWTSLALPLPPGSSYVGDQIDAVVNGALDMAVVAVRADTSATSRIIVHKVTDLSGTPDVRTYQVGDGDRRFFSGLGSSPRMDFMTMGLLPDGRVVTTFGDAKHASPRMAIEQP